MYFTGYAKISLVYQTQSAFIINKLIKMGNNGTHVIFKIKEKAVNKRSESKKSYVKICEYIFKIFGITIKYI